MNRRWDRSHEDLLAHGDPRGYGPLRQAVCDYVTTARGVRCTHDQVLIVAGTQQAISLTAQVVLDPGDPVPEYLYWVGCAASFDERARETAR